MAERIYLSSFVGATVFGRAEERVGKVADVIVRPTEERFPRVAGLVIQGGLESRFFVSAAAIGMIRLMGEAIAQRSDADETSPRRSSRGRGSAPRTGARAAPA